MHKADVHVSISKSKMLILLEDTQEDFSDKTIVLSLCPTLQVKMQYKGGQPVCC